VSDELLKLRQAVKQRQRLIERENARVDEAVLAAYRARRDDGSHEWSLEQIGDVLGVTRQRAWQVVRQAAARVGLEEVRPPRG
jgi:DNA-directed RNA polymerase sigma subunit (sigma70/sigma32)